MGDGAGDRQEDPAVTPHEPQTARGPAEPGPQRLSQPLDGPWRAYLGDPTCTVSPEPGEARRLVEGAFTPGQVLAGRFHVRALLGAGGMGEVYEAEDSVLRERVALKTLRAEVQAARSGQDFMREIHLARKVTHPNVCRIFDVFHHRDEAAGRETAFLSMEFLAGETLAQRLRRAGPFAPAEALPLIEQMAQALDAAHARGVVHRDFKSSNVMLVPGSPPTSTPRAVVTDFGLAQGQAGDDHFATTGTGSQAVGTPVYMAPEQVTSGRRVGPAADIYALGVVAFEMLTGRPPFLGENALATAALRLQGPAPSPRRFAPHLDARWERALLRCLEREPAARFERALDFPRALSSGSRLSPRAHRVLGVGLLALAVAGAWHASRRESTPGPDPATSPARTTRAGATRAPGRRSVAVLGFRNLAGRPEHEWLSTALAEMLASELAAGGGLRLISGANVARARQGLGWRETDTLEGTALGRLGTLLAADLLVGGSYLALGERAGGALRLDLRVQDAASGEALHTLIENGREPELPALVARCGERLRGALGDTPAPEAARTARALFVADAGAARAYAEGLALLRRYDAVAARGRLQAAAQAEPRHALIQAALADAWRMLGHQHEAQQAARRALELAVGLPREERLLVEARAKEHTFDWAGAAEIYRTLAGFFPDNVDYGLALAETESKAGRPQAALSTVAQLRRLPPPANADARIDMAEARAATGLSDFKRAARVAGAAAARGLAVGAKLVAAEARLHEAWALFRLGEPATVRLRAEEAQRLYAEAGDRGSAADATQLVAHVLWMQQGDFAGAERLYREALAAYRATGNARGQAGALLNLAGPRAEQGDLAGARQLGRQALPMFRAVGDRDDELAALVNLGTLGLDLGQLESARDDLAAALELARSIGSRSGQAHALEELGRERLLAADLDGARERHARALALREELSEKATAAVSRVSLLRVGVEQRAYEATAGQARALVQELQAAGLTERAAAAAALWARAELGRGQLEAARQAAARAEELARGLGRLERAGVEVVAARVQADGPERAQALQRLRRLRTETARAGPADRHFEAWRALVELGEEDAAGLSRAAQRRGFALYARP